MVNLTRVPRLGVELRYKHTHCHLAKPQAIPERDIIWFENTWNIFEMYLVSGIMWSCVKYIELYSKRGW